MAQSSGGFQLVDRAAKRSMHQVADLKRVERQRFVGLFRSLPAERVAPDETQRIAQKQLQRCGGHRSFEKLPQPFVAGCDKSVVGRYVVAVPIPPAAEAGYGDGHAREFLRPREQAVRLAEGVLGSACAVEVKLL